MIDKAREGRQQESTGNRQKMTFDTFGSSTSVIGGSRARVQSRATMAPQKGRRKQHATTPSLSLLQPQ